MTNFINFKRLKKALLAILRLPDSGLKLIIEHFSIGWQIAS